MEVKTVWALYYSATGNTKRLTLAAAKGAAERLGLPLRESPFSTPVEREALREFQSGELVFVGCPTYAGKLPNKLLPSFQEKLRGGGAFAAALVSFGNRSFDHALSELGVTLEGDGFHTVSGAAFVGEHAFAPSLAAGRPNEEDLAAAEDFGRKTAEKLLSCRKIPEAVQVPGDAAAPYYVPKGLDGEPAKFLKAKPKTREELCTGCGLCATLCPMGSIDPRDVRLVPGVCIKCQACVRDCPTGAKYFDDPAFLSHKAMLEKNFQRKQEHQSFF